MDGRRWPTYQARAMTSTGTSSMGGAQTPQAINGRGAILVLHAHNASSASGQAPEEEGPGSC